MGKGNNKDCSATMDAMPVPDSEALQLANIRTRFRPVLQGQLQELIDQANLLDSRPAEVTLERIMKQYIRCRLPNHYMYQFRRQMRRKLVQLLIKDDAALAAITMAFSADFSAAGQRKMISLISQQASRPEDISRCRHARAALYYRTGNLESARAELKEDQADSRVHSRRRSLAKIKLQALEGLKEPGCWEEDLIPHDMRETESGAWYALNQDGLGDGDGRTAGTKLSRALAREGRSEEALELCDRMMAHQWNDSEVEWVHWTRAVVLGILGRQDQMTELAETPNHLKEKVLDELADDLQAEGHKAEGYSMRNSANQAAEAQMKESDQLNFTGRKRHYLDRLIQYNDFDRAWLTACQEDADDKIAIIEHQLLVLVSACSYSPGRWLPELQSISQGAEFGAMPDRDPPNDLKQQTLALL